MRSLPVVARDKVKQKDQPWQKHEESLETPTSGVLSSIWTTIGGTIVWQEGWQRSEKFETPTVAVLLFMVNTKEV